jgi:hypothetical protein
MLVYQRVMTGWWFGICLFFHILGISSSQLTNSYFSRWLKPPTSKTNVTMENHHLEIGKSTFYGHVL